MAEIRSNEDRTSFVLITSEGWWLLLESDPEAGPYKPWDPALWRGANYPLCVAEVPEDDAEEIANRFCFGVKPADLLAWVEARKADAADAPAARFTPSEGSDPRMLEVFGFEPSSPMTPPCPTVGEAFDQIRSIVLMMEGGAAETRALLAAVNAYFAPSRE